MALKSILPRADFEVLEVVSDLSRKPASRNNQQSTHWSSIKMQLYPRSCPPIVSAATGSRSSPEFPTQIVMAWCPRLTWIMGYSERSISTVFTRWLRHLEDGRGLWADEEGKQTGILIPLNLQCHLLTSTSYNVLSKILAVWSPSPSLLLFHSPNCCVL